MLKKRLPEVPSSLPEWLQEALTSCLSFDTAARLSISQLHQVRNNNSNTNNAYQLRKMQVSCAHFNPWFTLCVFTFKRLAIFCRPIHPACFTEDML